MRPTSSLRALLATLTAALLTGVVLLTGPAVAGAAPGSSTAPADRGTPDGSIGIRLLDVPAKSKDDPRAQLYIIDNLNPGTTITRHVQVTNGTDTAMKIAVYPGPAGIVDGSFVPGEPGTKNLLTSWTSVDKPNLNLAPGQKARVAVTIAVPKDAPEMEQYGVIWASTVPNQNKETGIGLASRVGVRMYLSTGPGNGPPSDFAIEKLEGRRGADNGAEVTAHVTNTGGRAVDVTGTLKLSEGPGGLSAKAVSSKGMTIAPGESADVVFAVPNSAQLPDGPWKAEVQLESGVHTHDSTASITFDQSDQTEGSSNTALIVTIVVIAAAALAGIAAWLLRRRRGSSSGPGESV
ncbi:MULTISPECIES: hypothetical protein [Gordonia]|uniref:CARDB domain-containing protein n=2 Tax=Gordonia TaxID=2053 RepID=L7LH40_9ACTN|nr:MULTISPECIES: hypothetical protein [Gordonia]GAC59417.1 hypothetical protein GSI01S_02_00570 [Gordonia sihwensis NBRC 108236]